VGSCLDFDVPWLEGAQQGVMYINKAQERLLGASGEGGLCMLKPGVAVTGTN
jgi:hypothetical protein